MLFLNNISDGATTPDTLDDRGQTAKAILIRFSQSNAANADILAKFEATAAALIDLAYTKVDSRSSKINLTSKHPIAKIRYLEL